jgi:hypothetical protein
MVYVLSHVNLICVLSHISHLVDNPREMSIGVSISRHLLYNHAALNGHLGVHCP